jgi:uncharacterized membrane protein YiaA
MIIRLVGIASLIVGIIVFTISFGRGFSYRLDLYLSIVLIVAGFVTYAIGAFREMKQTRKKGIVMQQ